MEVWHCGAYTRPHKSGSGHHAMHPRMSGSEAKHGHPHAHTKKPHKHPHKGGAHLLCGAPGYSQRSAALRDEKRRGCAPRGCAAKGGFAR
eukprot:40336-Chlamydomonas_euryale.AAC.1